MTSSSLRKLVLIPFFSALTAVGAFLKIPTPIVPFTTQYLFCAYSGVFLGARGGLISQLLYVGIGLMGFPVFAKGGGITYVFQPTFGYLLGFIGCAFVVGHIVGDGRPTFLRAWAASLAGLALVYLVGVSYLYFVLNFYAGKPISFGKAISIGFLPFIGPDLFWTLVVAYTASRVKPRLVAALSSA